MISALPAVRAALDYIAPLPPKEESHQLKKQYVRNTVTEIVLVGLLTGLSCNFAKTYELRWAFIKKAVTVLGVNAAARMVATACRYAAIVESGLFFRSVSLGVDCLAPLYFAKEFNPFYFIIHEGGHAFSAYLLTQRASIQIVANSMVNWKTHYTFQGLSKLGNYLGADRCRLVITAAGALATVITNQIMLIFALSLKNSYPELSKYLFFAPLSSLLKELKYVHSALTMTDHPDGHDFVLLWKEGGIHPWASMASLVGMPFVTTCWGLSRY